MCVLIHLVDEVQKTSGIWGPCHLCGTSWEENDDSEPCNGGGFTIEWWWKRVREIKPGDEDRPCVDIAGIIARDPEWDSEAMARHILVGELR